MSSGDSLNTVNSLIKHRYDLVQLAERFGLFVDVKSCAERYQRTATTRESEPTKSRLPAHRGLLVITLQTGI
jgi:hypothetical protein